MCKGILADGELAVDEGELDRLANVENQEETVGAVGDEGVGGKRPREEDSMLGHTRTACLSLSYDEWEELKAVLPPGRTMVSIAEAER